MTKEQMLSYVLARYEEKLIELMGNDFYAFEDIVMDELDEKEKKDDSKRDG